MVRREAWISGDSSAGVSVLSGSASATIRRTSLASWRTLPGHEKSSRYSSVSSDDRQPSLALLVGVLADVVLDQRRNLLAALAQRRQRQAHDVEAVEQVVAEPAVGDQAFDAGVGRGDDADVDLDRLRLAERVDLVRLEEAQQLRLHLGADLADLVEEQRAAGGRRGSRPGSRCRRR